MYCEGLIYVVRGSHFNIVSFLKRSQEQLNTPLFLTRSAQLPHLSRVSCSDLFLYEKFTQREEKRGSGICGKNLLPHKLDSHGSKLYFRSLAERLGESPIRPCLAYCTMHRQMIIFYRGLRDRDWHYWQFLVHLPPNLREMNEFLASPACLSLAVWIWIKESAQRYLPDLASSFNSFFLPNRQRPSLYGLLSDENLGI